MQQHILTT